MRAMVFHGNGAVLQEEDVELPPLDRGQVLIDVEACGVCRTDLHIIDGELTEPVLPLILGHEIVGRISQVGTDAGDLVPGQRVGVPWLGRTCGSCSYCQCGAENLCDAPRFTGYTLNGGYAEACIAHADYVFPLPEEADPVTLAPLLCAGLIGYRCLRMAGEAQRIGFYGFGAAAHILAQIATFQGREVYAFTRAGDDSAQEFARRLGVSWAGTSDDAPPALMDSAIIFAPVGSLVPTALKSVRKGGRVICGGIHMSDIPTFPYQDLWHERQIRSVANMTRQDGEEFFPLAQRANVKVQTTPYALWDANAALDDLRCGRLHGAAVLVP